MKSIRSIRSFLSLLPLAATLGLAVPVSAEETPPCIWETIVELEGGNIVDNPINFNQSYICHGYEE